MFRIGKLFHLTQVVDDLERVDRWHDDVFAAERFYHGYEESAGRDASLVAIGDVVLEPMTPARVEPLRQPVGEALPRPVRAARAFHRVVRGRRPRDLGEAGRRRLSTRQPRRQTGETTAQGERRVDTPAGNAGPAGVRGLWRLPARSAHEERLVERTLAPSPAGDRTRFLDRHRGERHDESKTPLLRRARWDADSTRSAWRTGRTARSWPWATTRWWSLPSRCYPIA